MNYTLHQLVIFLKVVEKSSITQAAEELHLTQPAVSIQLKKFQNQFDIPLTEIIGRKLYVTDFGREVANVGQKVLDEANALKIKSLAYKGLLAGQLKISVVSTGKYVMPFFLADFLQKFPEIELKMDVTNKVRVIQSLQNNEIDFALVSVPPPKIKFKSVDLMQNKLFMTRKLRPAIKEEKVTRKTLEKVQWIYREKGSATRLAMEAYINGREIPHDKSIELTSNEAVKQAVIAGLGYSIMPLIGIKNELQNKELEIVPLKGLPIITQWSLIWLKEKKHSPVAKEYLKFVEANKESIIQRHFLWYENYQ